MLEYRSELLTGLMICLMLITAVGCSNEEKNYTSEYKIYIDLNKGLTGKVEKSPEKSKYKKGTTVTLTAKPEEIFAYWGDDENDTNNIKTVTVQEDITVTATFGLTFGDEKIEKIIRNKIDKPEGLLLPADVEDIEKLTIQNEDISSLAGIEYLPNLTSIYFEDCIINSFESLSKMLDAVKKISFIDTTLNSFAGIEKIKKVTDLRIGGCSIKNWDNLEKLNELVRLQISNTDINDSSFISKLTNLKEIKLYNNELSSLAALEDINALEEIYIIDNDIIKIDELSGLDNLAVLYIEQCGLQDITAVKEMTSVEWFNFSNNDISDISSFSDLITREDLKLKWVYLDGNPLNNSADDIINQIQNQDIYVRR